MKYAILSMDIENWFHLDYLSSKGCDQTYSMLDGLDAYLEVINSYQIPSSFFVLGELALPLKNKLREISDLGHDIGSHGWRHTRPLNMEIKKFQLEVETCKKELEQLLGRPVIGYRAPCFSLDAERLEILKKVGYKYDSSRILFGGHPLYGDLDMSRFDEKSSGIYCIGDFFEFQISTLPVCGKQIPVSGGGYLRIFPWALMNHLLKRYLKNDSLYVLYIHPFEFSSKTNPDFPKCISLANRFRFSLGRPTVIKKFNRVIKLLKENGFQFTRFSALRKKFLTDNEPDTPSACNGELH